MRYARRAVFTPAMREVEAPRLLGEVRELLRLAVPIAVAQAGIALMGVVDTAVVGRLGAAALGAVGLANGIFSARKIGRAPARWSGREPGSR